MARRNQLTEIERRLTRPSVLLTEYLTGLGYETVRFLSNGINTALVRGLEGGVEAVLLGLTPLATIHSLRTINTQLNTRGNAHRRYNNATIRLLPNAALIGAALNGFRHYFDRVPDTSVYLNRLAVGATEGVVVVGIPYLLYLGQRHGVYGRIGDAYMNANRAVYNFVNTRVVAHYGPTWGRIAGAGSVVGSNITTGGALYGLGRIANLW